MNPQPKNITEGFGVDIRDLDAALQVGHKVLMFKVCGSKMWPFHRISLFTILIIIKS